MAPEIVKKVEFCGPPTDIYASGVLLFAFFCGQFPFRGQSDKELYSKIIAGNLNIPDHVPSGPRSVILKCMQNKAENRPTAAELCADPWLQAVHPTSDQSLLSYSSRQPYSTRGSSFYYQAGSSRYPKPSINPFSPNHRSGRNNYPRGESHGINNFQPRTQTTRGESRNVNPKSGQIINNNINIINNIT